jgi:Fanconi anemia group M protein
MVQTNLSMFLKEDTPAYGENNTYVHHQYIQENTILARQYQLDIARHALSRNTAVILPTGLGKTIIALLVMADILPKRVLFLAPTKPLVQQHYESCKKFLTIDEQAIQMLVGNISAKKRAAIFNQATIIVATPQTIQNDLENKRYALKNFGLVIFDEMHRAVERYAYVTIAKHCRCRILGLTASPGSKKKKINKILENLKITHIESRIRDDFDVKDHVKEILIDWIKVPMDTNLRTIQKPLHELYLEKLGKLNKLGILTYKKPEYLSKKDILGARATIQKRFRKKPFVFATYNNHTVLLHANHCLELIETQGIDSFLKYVEKYTSKQKRSRSEQMFINHPLLQQAVALARREPVLSHPKLAVLQQIVEHQFGEEPDSLILIFTQYRDTIDSIEETLKQVPQTRFHRFIGQAGQGTTKGMNQKEQQQILDQFRKREINILIATSIGEEGIDIPNVNKVVFYEPIPSEIRGIQRKGRTGRSHIGKVTILITEGTRDEAYFYAEKQKEQKMHNIVRKMR